MKRKNNRWKGMFLCLKATLGISSLAITAFVGLGMATEASAE